MRYTGWRRRLAQHLGAAEKMADAVSKSGAEEYATGVLDAIEYLETVLTYEECKADPTAMPELVMPALVERVQALPRKQAAVAEEPKVIL